MNDGTPISGAFRAIFWRFPNHVPHPPDTTESELAGRRGTRELLGRYIRATGSEEFQALVIKHQGTNPEDADAPGPAPLARSVHLAIHELGP